MLVARRADKLETLAAELSARHRVRTWVEATDLSLPDAAKKLYGKLRRKKLVIDILVNNAGIIENGAFVDMPPERGQELIGLNVAAMTAMLSYFIPPMVARGHGRILNLGSTSSFLPVPTLATYAATKAFVLSMTESLSEELKGLGGE